MALIIQAHSLLKTLDVADTSSDLNVSDVVVQGYTQLCAVNIKNKGFMILSCFEKPSFYLDYLFKASPPIEACSTPLIHGLGEP